MAISTDEFECSFSEESGGRYFIESNGEDFIVVENLAFSNQTVFCDFKLLKTQLEKDDIEELILVVLLIRFQNAQYMSDAHSLSLTNLESGQKWICNLAPV